MTNEEINLVYKEKGLNGVYALLRKNGVKYKVVVNEFGLNTNKQALKEKSEWINEGNLRFHYYSLSVKSRKTGYTYNRIRGIEIVIL